MTTTTTKAKIITINHARKVLRRGKGYVPSITNHGERVIRNITTRIDSSFGSPIEIREGEATVNGRTVKVSSFDRGLWTVSN